MNVVIGFHKGDFTQAEALAGRMLELGPYSGHSLTVYRDKSVPSGASPFIASLGFDKITEIEITNDEWHKWPESPNNVFRTASVLFEYVTQTPWLLLEPDCVLIRRGWLDAIAGEYQAGAKPFMGCLVKGFRVERTDNGEIDFVPDHMSGVGIYPADTKSQAGAATMAHEVPWDVVGAEVIVPNAHFTRLIQHNWRPPPFAGIADAKAELWPEAVIYHRDKSGALLSLLRRMEAGETEPPPVPSNVFIGFDPAVPGGDRTVTTILPAVPVLADSGKCVDARSSRDADEAPESTTSAIGGFTADSGGGGQNLWETQVSAVASIRGYCAALWLFCDTPSHLRIVREELAFAGLLKRSESRPTKRRKRKTK